MSARFAEALDGAFGEQTRLVARVGYLCLVVIERLDGALKGSVFVAQRGKRLDDCLDCAGHVGTTDRDLAAME